jgi:hypothetical protein
MEQNGLSRRQRFIVVWMVLTLVGVVIALIAIVRRDAPNSPLATVIARAGLATATASMESTSDVPTAVVGANDAQAPTAIQPGVSAQLLAARKIERLDGQVGDIRELPKQQEIVLNFLDESQMASMLRQLENSSDRREFVDRQQALLAALGLAPAVGEAFPTSVQTRAKHVVAFYDRTEGQIFIGPPGADADAVDASLVHQYGHAYVDQHFDLHSYGAGVFSADSLRARDALVEGDATAVLAMHSFGGLDRVDLTDLSDDLSEAELTDYEGYLTSRSLDDVLRFPYREGARFVAALLASGWWPAVNAAYGDPPVSTEQILHPERYLDEPRDDPRTVLLPDLREDLGEGWRLITQDVLGELLLRVHMDQYLPDSDEAVEAADGWDGDLAALWQDGDGNEILVLRTLWDSSAEAAEFYRSYVEVVDRRLEGALGVRRSIVPTAGRWWRGDEGNAYLGRNDDEVLIIWTPDSETMEQVLSVFVFGDE